MLAIWDWQTMAAIATVAAAVIAAIALFLNEKHRNRELPSKLEAWVAAQHVSVPNFPPGLNGIEVRLTSRGTKTFRVSRVALSLRGIDVISKISQGWSGGLGYVPVPDASLDEHGVDVELRLHHNERLYLNTDSGGGLALAPDRSVCFFTPIQLPGGLLDLFLSASPKQLAINVELEDRTKLRVVDGKVLHDLLPKICASWGNSPCDPRYEFRINVIAISPCLPDTSAAGTVNDKEFGLSP